MEQRDRRRFRRDVLGLFPLEQSPRELPRNAFKLDESFRSLHHEFLLGWIRTDECFQLRESGFTGGVLVLLDGLRLLGDRSRCFALGPLDRRGVTYLRGLCAVRGSLVAGLDLLPFS